MLFTDADCLVPPNWLLNTATNFNNPKVQFQAGPVLFTPLKSFLSWFQQYDFKAMRSMFADSAIFYTDNGSIKNIQEFLDDIAKDASSDTVSTWDMTYVFSVNSDNDTAGGEWVNAGFKVEGSVNDSTIVKNNYIEWYYVIDGKVAEYSSSKRKIKL